MATLRAGGEPALSFGGKAHHRSIEIAPPDARRLPKDRQIRLQLSPFRPYNATVGHESIIVITLALAIAGLVVLYAAVRNS